MQEVVFLGSLQLSAVQGNRMIDGRETMFLRELLMRWAARMIDGRQSFYSGERAAAAQGCMID